MQNIANKLLKWYDKQGRKDLPWRSDITPYRVWLSEIMLQQTQVATVIPYFENFIRHFPTLKKLAQAHEDDVLHCWSGLGYYSRARNLLKAAKIIAQNYQYQFPDDLEKLISLPGIGRSTAGAILAIVFKQQVPILDGNVKRVLTRFYAIEGWPEKSKIKEQLWDIAEKQTPKKRVDDYTQAIMDLGATLCTRRNPNCDQCPLLNNCKAHSLEIVNTLPTPKPKKVLPSKSTIMLMIYNSQQEILLIKRPPSGIWGGLWSLPECSLDTDINNYCQQQFGFNIEKIAELGQRQHTFSHFHLHIKPILLAYKENIKNRIMEPQINIWYSPDSKTKLGLATPIRKLLREINC